MIIKSIVKTIISCLTLASKEQKELMELGKVLPTISSVEKLVFLQRNTLHESEQRRYIEFRIIQVLEQELPNITDISLLISYLDDACENKLVRLIEKRLIELLEPKLLHINDMSWLILCFKRFRFKSEPLKKLIKKRMEWVLISKLKTLKDIPLLISYRFRIFRQGSASKLVEQRLEAVLEKELPTITDEYKLRFYERSIDSVCRCKELVQQRLNEIYAS